MYTFMCPGKANYSKYCAAAVIVILTRERVEGRLREIRGEEKSGRKERLQASAVAGHLYWVGPNMGLLKPFCCEEGANGLCNEEW